MYYNTKETRFEYQVKEMMKRYKEGKEIDLKGDELYSHIWENKEFFAVIALEIIHEYGGDDMFGSDDNE